MGTPYVGEIRMFAGNFAPAGWAFCNGAQLAISENDVLFQLIGTTYGGDGQNTFNLPDLQSRVPVHMGTGGGSSYIIGQTGGEEQVTLTTAQIPVHSHPPLCNSGPGNQGDPSGGIWGQQATTVPYINNVTPTLAMAINFIISLFGVFPSPT